MLGWTSHTTGGCCEACSDTDNGKTDSYGDDCADYQDAISWCGSYDTNEFDSMTMCCACGGGGAVNAPVAGGTCTDPDPNADGTGDYVCPTGYIPKHLLCQTVRVQMWQHATLIAARPLLKMFQSSSGIHCGRPRRSSLVAAMVLL